MSIVYSTVQYSTVQYRDLLSLRVIVSPRIGSLEAHPVLPVSRLIDRE